MGPNHGGEVSSGTGYGDDAPGRVRYVTEYVPGPCPTLMNECTSGHGVRTKNREEQTAEGRAEKYATLLVVQIRLWI